LTPTSFWYDRSRSLLKKSKFVFSSQAKNSAEEVFEQSLNTILETAGCGNLISHVGSRLAEDSCFLVVKLMSRDETKLLSENFVFPVAFGNVMGIAMKPLLEVIFIFSMKMKAVDLRTHIFSVM